MVAFCKIVPYAGRLIQLNHFNCIRRGLVVAIIKTMLNKKSNRLPFARGLSDYFS